MKFKLGQKVRFILGVDVEADYYLVPGQIYVVRGYGYDSGMEEYRTDSYDPNYNENIIQVSGPRIYGDTNRAKFYGFSVSAFKSLAKRGRPINFKPVKVDL